MARTEASSKRQIVAADRFILATRDAGYRGTVSAIAELVDNAIQAQARAIRILLRESGERRSGRWHRRVEVAVIDDGQGMDREQLWGALQFGGSSRFADRSGLGRFGMGLPNSSVSQGRRIEIYSWQSTDAVRMTYLDVDEVAEGRLYAIPMPVRSKLPAHVLPLASDRGTLVVWPRCDRLDFRKASTLSDKLRGPLGRIYRRAIWNGLQLFINDRSVEAVDPMFSNPSSGEGGAKPYGAPMQYEFAGQSGRCGVITVRFTLLPVAAWSALPVEEKRRLGIIGGAGITFLRAGREIDAGWKLFGEKRRENYDDWWRCEVEFPPTLDEEFGVTHSKQGVSPSPALKGVLVPDLEAIARELNRRVRKAFARTKQALPSRAVTLASARDATLPTTHLPRHLRGSMGMTYALRTRPLASPRFFRTDERDGQFVVTINTRHPFFSRIYAPLKQSENADLSFALELLLLAAGRAELDAGVDSRTQDIVRQLRDAWSDALVAFLDHSHDG